MEHTRRVLQLSSYFSIRNRLSNRENAIIGKEISHTSFQGGIYTVDLGRSLIWERTAIFVHSLRFGYARYSSDTYPSNATTITLVKKNKKKRIFIFLY